MNPQKVLKRKKAERSPENLFIKWFGTSAFQFRYRDTILLIDPFISRPNLFSLIFGELKPHARLLDRHFPRADYIFVTHGHYDHLSDVPYLAARTGAPVYCSASSANILRGFNLPEKQINVVESGTCLKLGSLELKVIKSRHNKSFMGEVPFDGIVKTPPSPPLKIKDFRAGEVFSIDLNCSGWRLFLSSTCNLIEESIPHHEYEVLILPLAGAQFTENYIQRMLRAVKPKKVMPSHYDNFFLPLILGKIFLPGINLKNLAKEIRVFDAQIEMIVPEYFQELALTIPATTPFPAQRSPKNTKTPSPTVSN